MQYGQQMSMTEQTSFNPDKLEEDQRREVEVRVGTSDVKKVVLAPGEVFAMTTRSRVSCSSVGLILELGGNKTLALLSHYPSGYALKHFSAISHELDQHLADNPKLVLGTVVSQDQLSGPVDSQELQKALNEYFLAHNIERESEVAN